MENEKITAQKFEEEAQSLFQGKRILFLLNDFSFFLTHRQGVARELLRRGAEVFVVAPIETLQDREALSGFHLIASPISRWGMNPLEIISEVGALTKIYKRVAPHLVDHITIKPVLLGSFAARIVGLGAIINYISGLGFVFLSSGVWAFARRSAIILAYRIVLKFPHTRTIFENPEDREFFVSRGMVHESSTVIIRGSGVPPEKFISRGLRGPCEHLTVLMVARVLVEKGVREFVDAARRAKNGKLPLRFVLVGDYPQGNPGVVPLEELSQWQNEGVIEYLGKQRDIAAITLQADIIVLPSYREGLPRALVEGAAAGKPLIATDVPGCREIVKDGVTGILINERDGSALFRAIEKLAQDPNMREELGAAARKLFHQGGFDEAAVIDKTLELYRGLLSSESYR